ncbi:MAG: hypothetical protein II166_03795, partial [Firmicutes bacterium]|nr:hypothetical protein [Bacillota bacterium]
MRKTIDLEKGCGIWLKALAVEVSGIIGLRSFSLDFPVARPQGGIVIRTAGPGQEGIFEEGGRLIIMAENSRTSFEDICRRLAEDPASYLGTEDDGRRAKAPEDLIFSSDHPGEAGFAEKTCFGGLERLFDCGGFFRDLNGDGLPDSVDLKILIAEDLSDSQTAAACDLAARIGAQTLGYEWPLTSTDRKDGKTLRFESSGHASVTFDRESGDIVIKGDGEELTGFTADFCASFPAASPGSDWRDFIDELNKSLEMKSPDGQLAALSMAGGRGSCLFSPGVEKTEGLKERFPEASIRSFREPVPVPGYHMVFEPRWEVDRVLDLMKGGVLTALGPDDVVDVSLAVSEDRQVRSALSGQIGETIEAAGARTGTIRTVCAYKQGFSWLDELVCPVLEGLGQKPGRLVIGYGQFLPGSGGEWMDLPIRLLQELYPIDDVLAQRLGISRDAVSFEPLECGGAPRYVVKALAKDGTLLYEESFTPSYSERRYLDSFEDTALVHPCTGRLTVLVNGKKALDEMIPTDLEMLWDFYQKEVLPACGRRIEEKCGGIPDPNLQPFFTQMRLDISVSEPDYSLPCRSDRLSSICAFHEDLYFAGLDYFNRLGLKKAGARLEAPGLILPVIRKAQGAPRMEFTLLENAADGPKLFSDGRQLIKPLGYRAELRSLSLSDGKKTAVIDLIEADRAEEPGGGDAELRDFTASYAALLEEGLLRASSMVSAADLVVFEAGGAHAACARVPEKSAPAPLAIEDVDLHETELIGPETYEEIIEKLMRVPGIRVRRESESVQGRSIHSIEILPRSSGFTSEIQR